MAKSRRKSHDGSSSQTQAASQSAGDSPATAPSRERVAARAYELYQARGGSDGQALDDWLSAEREFSRDEVQRNELDRGEVSGREAREGPEEERSGREEGKEDGSARRDR